MKAKILCENARAKLGRLLGRWYYTSPLSDTADFPSIEGARLPSGSRGRILTHLNALCQFKVQGC